MAYPCLNRVGHKQYSADRKLRVPLHSEQTEVRLTFFHFCGEMVSGEAVCWASPGVYTLSAFGLSWSVIDQFSSGLSVYQFLSVVDQFSSGLFLNSVMACLSQFWYVIDQFICACSRSYLRIG